MHTPSRAGSDLHTDVVDERRRRLLGAAAASAALPWLSPNRAFADNWPSRPIRIIAAQAPGSSNDSTSRALGEFF